MGMKKERKTIFLFHAIQPDPSALQSRFFRIFFFITCLSSSSLFFTSSREFCTRESERKRGKNVSCFLFFASKRKKIEVTHFSLFFFFSSLPKSKKHISPAICQTTRQTTPRSAPFLRKPSARLRRPRGRRPATRPSGTVRSGEEIIFNGHRFPTTTKKKKKKKKLNLDKKKKKLGQQQPSHRLLRPRPGVRRGRGMGTSPQEPEAAAAERARDRLLPGGPLGSALQARGPALRRRLGRGRAGEGGREKNGRRRRRNKNPWFFLFYFFCCLRRRVRWCDRARESRGHAGRCSQAPRRALRRGEAAREREDRKVPEGSRGQNFLEIAPFSSFSRLFNAVRPSPSRACFVCV